MITAYPITSAVERVMGVAVLEMRHLRFDTPSFFSALWNARFEISNCKHQRADYALFVTLDRCEALYFTAHSAFYSLKKSPSFERAVYLSASKIALEALMLFNSFATNGDYQDFLQKAVFLLSCAESFFSVSRYYRSRAISNSKSLGKALGEIEYIQNCERTVLRSKRLVSSYFALL